MTVPALMDTLTCQSFFDKGMLVGFIDDLCGDDGRVGGAMLRQMQAWLTRLDLIYYCQHALYQRVYALTTIPQT